MWRTIDQVWLLAHDTDVDDSVYTTCDSGFCGIRLQVGEGGDDMKRGPRKFDDTMYVKVYELAKSGLVGSKLAGALGIDFRTFKKWKRDNEAFADAINKARKLIKKDSKEGTFIDYVEDRLPPELQDMWHKLMRWDKEPNGVRKIEQMLNSGGLLVRMQLFVHALIQKNFNVSAACRTVNISLGTFDNWCTMNPDFARLVGNIELIKKDFFEEALVDLVRQRDTAAVIFANKTKNRDRGYNDKVEVNVTGNVTNTHLIDISVLNLPIEVKRLILDAWRKHKEKNQLPQPLEYRLDGDKAVPVETDGQEIESEAA